MAHRARNLLFKGTDCLKCFVRYKSQRRTLGKPPGIARTLEQRLTELHYKDPEIHFKVNIGFALKKLHRKEVCVGHGKHIKNNRNNAELEKLSRNGELIIPLDEVEREWSETVAPTHIKAMAEHYAVFEHLFGDAYFYPVVTMAINYMNGDSVVPAYWGNILKPEEAKSMPNVSFDCKPDTLWTLVMTTPDGNFSSENTECCHWFVGNIKDGDLKSGEVIVDYMQPLPVQGLGYLRYIFILYKQEELLDFSGLKLKSDKNTLEERNFSTYEFYKERQKSLTPAGLSFFTADWDQTVTEYFNKTFSSDCPKFIYDFPEHFYKKQTWFPLRQPFNLYLDRYRDQKEIAKEYLVKKLKATDPFKEPPKPLLYPNAIPFKPGTPSWLKNEIIKERLGLGRAKDFL
uniref:Large ribosomal subunit protein mL38 n=1 Tax=Panstrongylus megistus TaxID=65343 RepID=A0A069DTB0_9HEMI